MKIAVPVTNGTLCQHFGHCEAFAFFDLAEDGRSVLRSDSVTAPDHVPGLLPKWLQERGVNVVLAGGMGARAQALFTEAGIRVITGVPGAPADELVSAYLNGTLTTGANVCDH